MKLPLAAPASGRHRPGGLRKGRGMSFPRYSDTKTARNARNGHRTAGGRVKGGATRRRLRAHRSAWLCRAQPAAGTAPAGSERGGRYRFLGPVAYKSPRTKRRNGHRTAGGRVKGGATRRRLRAHRSAWLCRAQPAAGTAPAGSERGGRCRFLGPVCLQKPTPGPTKRKLDTLAAGGRVRGGAACCRILTHRSTWLWRVQPAPRTAPAGSERGGVARCAYKTRLPA